MNKHPIYVAALKEWKANPAREASISTTDTAKLIRVVLGRKFPGVKFSVKSSKYAGGSSIRVHWIDGPTAKLVEAYVKTFAGADFDGMIDLKFYSGAWLYPNGDAAFRETGGTAGSGGYHPAAQAGPDFNGAIPVYFSADYVFCERSHSAAALGNVLKAYAAKWADELAAAINAGKVEIVESEFGAWLKGADAFKCEAHGAHHASDGSRILYMMAERRMLPAFMPKVEEAA